MIINQDTKQKISVIARKMEKLGFSYTESYNKIVQDMCNRVIAKELKGN